MVETPQSREHFAILRKACMAVASAQMSCYPELYEKYVRAGTLKSPLQGHCGAVASMIHGMFGGEIVTGRVNDEPHYWNRLPDGSEVDLTSCQFGGDGFTPLRKGRKVKKRELVSPRFLIFAAMVLEKIRG